jgi:hypothetical protein
MVEPIRFLTLQINAWRKSVIKHFGVQKWSYIFAAFVWALVWYAIMNVLTIMLRTMPGFGDIAPFPIDPMPIVAGLPIIIVGWRAVTLGDELRLAVQDFDDGAAFVFPAGKPGTRRVFLEDLKKTVTWYSRIVSVGIFALCLVGVLSITATNGLNATDLFGTVLLIVGAPLIALPIGMLLGQLVGYAQFVRIMDRNGIALAGLSTPQARTALRGLENVHAFAVVALSVLCFWFAAWWALWMFGYGEGYEQVWRTQFLMLWIVAIGLFIAAGVWPAWSFRRRVAELTGGEEGREAINSQIKQATEDLARWQDVSSETSRQQRERIVELKRFIANLNDQRIGSWLLDPRFHAALVVLNLLILVLPMLVPATPLHTATF